MNMPKLKNLHMYRDRSGVFRCYVRRKGLASIPVLGKIGSPAFLASYRAAMALKRANKAKPVKPVKPVEYADGPHIYFLRGYGRVKVGTTRKPGKRLDEIQVSSPVPLSVLLIMPGDVILERRIHRRFRSIRQHGEWFLATPEFLEFVESLRKNGEHALAINRDFVANEGEKTEHNQSDRPHIF